MGKGSAGTRTKRAATPAKAPKTSTRTRQREAKLDALFEASRGLLGTFQKRAKDTAALVRKARRTKQPLPAGFDEIPGAWDAVGEELWSVTVSPHHEQLRSKLKKYANATQ